MNPQDQDNLKAHIKQVDAIFAIEGSEPSESMKETDRAVLAGETTYAESIEALKAKYTMPTT